MPTLFRKSLALLAVLYALFMVAPALALTPPARGAVDKPAEFVITPPWAPGVERLVTASYGDINTHQHTDRTTGSNDYHALDLAFARGEPVYPIAPGRVVYAGRATSSWSAYGNIVFLDHGNGYQSLYAHLDSLAVAKDAEVTTATLLGGAGNTGTSEVHLHLALYKGALFNTANNRYGPYGGQAVVPEPFANCVKNTVDSCENILRGARLRHIAAAGAPPPPLELKIIRPSATQPANVGSPTSPRSFVVEFDLAAGDVRREEVSVQVGGVNAPVSMLAGRYRMWAEVSAPPQANAGLYDLSLSVRGQTVVAAQAVRYTNAAAVDVVLVLDRSGSMSSAKIQAAREAAKQFIDLMRPGDRIGVASFGSLARVDFALQPIAATNDETRARARAAVNAITASGSTAMGAGMAVAQDEIDARSDPSHGRAIVLLSDGQENVAPSSESVLPRLIAAGTTLHAIGFGGDADQRQLLDLALATGGTYNFAPGADRLADVYSNIAGAVANRQALFAAQGTLAVGASRTELASVDAAVRDAVFTVSWVNPNARIAVVLEHPNGTRFTPATANATPGVSFIGGSSYSYYRVTAPAIAAGTWKLLLTRSGNAAPQAEPFAVAPFAPEAELPEAPELVAEAVESDAAATELLEAEAALQPDQANTSEPYSVRVLGDSDLSLRLLVARDNYRAREPIQLLALLGGRQPVAGASVVVKLQNAAGYVFGEVTLADDGRSGDGAAGDGVYGGTWASLRGGSYSFSATATGTSPATGPYARRAEVSTVVGDNPLAGPLLRVYLPSMRTPRR